MFIKNSLFWENKLGDIIKYLGQNLEKNMLSEQYQEMLSCMGPSDNVQKLAELCGRNFLFLTHALEFWVKEGNVLNFPSNVENIYRVNLIRIFGKTENIINNMQTIFEILCAISLGSVSESVLFDVLNEKGSHQHINYISRGYYQMNYLISYKNRLVK